MWGCTVPELSGNDFGSLQASSRSVMLDLPCRLCKSVILMAYASPGSLGCCWSSCCILTDTHSYSPLFCLCSMMIGSRSGKPLGLLFLILTRVTQSQSKPIGSRQLFPCHVALVCSNWVVLLYILCRSCILMYMLPLLQSASTWLLKTWTSGFYFASCVSCSMTVEAH